MLNIFLTTGIAAGLCDNETPCELKERNFKNAAFPCL